jgi:hypothetical protein
MTDAIPRGTPTIVPHLVVRGGSQAIDFYKKTARRKATRAKSRTKVISKPARRKR